MPIPTSPAICRSWSKGAPEILLSRCRYVMQTRPAGRAQRQQARQHRATQRRARKPGAARAGDRDPQHAGRDAGHRPAKPASDVELPESVEEELVLLGLVGMIDPPRAEVKDAVALARQAHIRTVMITGDHPATAAAIAQELNILETGSRVVTGSELRTMDDAQLDAHRRGRARVRPRRSRPQAADRPGAAAQGSYRRHDRRRHQRRAGAEDGQCRHRHGHHRHGRVEGSRRHRADRRQLRQHREGHRGRPRRLRQHPEVSAVPAVDQLRRADDDVRRRDVRRRAGPDLRSMPDCSCRCLPRNCCGSTSSPTGRRRSRLASIPRIATS